ncbi:MAG: hypothetical protein VX115_08525, partial [Candidatus Thermoplasmatota archaeon]|nr:hypothetical protein [Candidatus Thermoplasmatota archaeon]MEC8107769.1 hypothetical protein [Candidatus Thermoplasmatota archaeon]
MSSISAQDLQRLAGLQGYDLTLEIDVMSRKYGMSPDEIVAILRSANQSQQPNQQPFEPVASKAVPELPNRPREISMEGLHFDYNPTAGAKDKRAQVDQAIVCPGCGVALGIPSRRPIKIKCPQCLHVATYN